MIWSLNYTYSPYFVITFTSAAISSLIRLVTGKGPRYFIGDPSFLKILL
jgi:hypothetical protein